MLMKVIGYEIKNGVFKDQSGKDVAWEKVYVYVTEPIKKDGEGDKTNYLKCRRDKLPPQLSLIVGANVLDINYDAYGNIKELKLEI